MRRERAVATAAASMLSLLLLVTLLPAPVAAQNSVWTVYNTVDVDVWDNYAVVRVVADIGNRGPDPEFPFQVLVPEGAFVSGLTVERDGVLWEAEVEDATVAREQYEDEKSQENTAALVEKRDTTRYAFLVNVAEFESVRAVLTYEVLLSSDADVYSLPLEAPVSGFGQDLGAAFDVRIHHSDGVSAAWSDPAVAPQTLSDGFRLHHEVGPRPDDASTPFTAYYSLPPTPDGGSLWVSGDDSAGYFAHRFRAPPDEAGLPLDLALVLDTSGSMSGQKMDQLQDAASQVVSLLDADDRLSLVPFDSAADDRWGGLRVADAATRTAAVEEVRGMLAYGGTNIEDGLRVGWGSLTGTDPERSRILVFLTDGQATLGETGDDALLAQTAGYRDDVRLFGLAFGEDADFSLVSALARQHGGTAQKVSSGTGAEVDLRAFMASLTTPVLEDVAIAYDGDVTAYQTGAPVLFQGSELLVVGTYRDLDAVAGTVTGRASDGDRSYGFSESVPDAQSPWLPRLVAAATIHHYEALMDAEGERDEWKAIVRGLAMEHGFVTDYTSLVLRTEVDEPTVREFDPDAWNGGGAVPASDSGTSSGGWAQPEPSPEPEPEPEPEPAPEPDTSGSPQPEPSAEDDANTPLPLWAVPVALLGAVLALRRR